MCSYDEEPFDLMLSYEAWEQNELYITRSDLDKLKDSKCSMSYELPNGETYTVITKEHFESMHNSVLTRKKLEELRRPEIITEKRTGREEEYFNKARRAERKFEELNNRFTKVKRLNQSLITEVSNLKKQVASFEQVLSVINRGIDTTQRNEELITIITDYEKLKAFNEGLIRLELDKLGLNCRQFKNLLFNVKTLRNNGCHPLASSRPCIKTIRPIINKYLQKESNII